MKAVEDVCGLYGVPVLRMQTRTFTVPGVGGRERPFFVGEWRDAMGVKHQKGMSDLLLMPKVNIRNAWSIDPKRHVISFTVPLWCECKFGTGKLSGDQEDFRDWVTSIGAAWIGVTDNCEELMKWFDEMGVRKP